MNARLWLSAFLLVGAGAISPAQNRASMESPVIKGEADVIKVSTRFKDFSATGDYRIGVGGEKNDLTGVQLELWAEDGIAVSAPMVDFTQGYTSSWWQVDEVRAKGFVFPESSLPGKVLTLRVTVPRADADAAGRIFVFVAKKYGPTTWYLEDGTALKQEYW